MPDPSLESLPPPRSRLDVAYELLRVLGRVVDFADGSPPATSLVTEIRELRIGTEIDLPGLPAPEDAAVVRKKPGPKGGRKPGPRSQPEAPPPPARAPASAAPRTPQIKESATRKRASDIHVDGHHETVLAQNVAELVKIEGPLAIPAIAAALHIGGAAIGRCVFASRKLSKNEKGEVCLKD